jgi:hypothetical protein
VYCRLSCRSRCDPMNHVYLKREMRPKEKFTTPLISIKAIIKSHLKHIIDLAIMSSEMIIVNIRRRKIDKSDGGKAEKRD